MERMTDADQAMPLLSLQREMAEMKRRTKEVVQKNEQEMQALRRENDEMKKKLMEGGPSTVEVADIKMHMGGICINMHMGGICINMLVRVGRPVTSVSVETLPLVW